MSTPISWREYEIQSIDEAVELIEALERFMNKIERLAKKWRGLKERLEGRTSSPYTYGYRHKSGETAIERLIQEYIEKTIEDMLKSKVKESVSEEIDREVDEKIKRVIEEIKAEKQKTND